MQEAVSMSATRSYILYDNERLGLVKGGPNAWSCNRLAHLDSKEAQLQLPPVAAADMAWQ